MTTETTERPGGGPEKLHPDAQPGDTFWQGVIFTLASTAIMSAFAGIALNRGFGVHAPFVATWVLTLVGLVLVRLVTVTVAGGWFNVKLKASPNIAAAEYVGQAAAEHAMHVQGAAQIDKVMADLKAMAEGQWAKPE